MLILKALNRGPSHGYAVAQFIQQASREVLRVEEGALYPALHRLEVARGCSKPNGARRKTTAAPSTTG